MTALKILFATLVVVFASAAGFLLYALHARIEPLAAPPGNFDAQLVKRGATLAAIGNCSTCHTVPGGKVFAGGRAIPTPFGTIHTTNITPDPQTGIGLWSEAAFQRSMRKGVDREGNHLYPAFPYDHFTLVSDEDNKALYAFLMTREPVAATPPANTLSFPFNIRTAIAGWKLLFFREGPYEPDPNQSQPWNRGAYLAEGLSHCGTCHTPRNALGAEDKSRAYGGAMIEGWWAYALNKDAPAPVPWNEDALYQFLRRGWHDAHGLARGPMSPVVENLAAVPDEDVRALANYTASLTGMPTPEQQQKGEALIAQARRPSAATTSPTADTQTTPAAERATEPGAKIYASTCASCHESGRPLPFGGLPLALSTGLNGPTPHNLINVTLFGLPPASGESSPIMPGFHGSLSDPQVVDLLRYLRRRFTDKPAWDSLEKDVAATRSGEHKPALYPTPGNQATPADPTQRGVIW
jgi:mono/diheme cytochrome c family protein